MSVNAQAYIVYDQLPHQTPAALNSIYGVTVVSDDFTLNSDYSIIGINWWGLNTPSSSVVPSFTLSISAAGTNGLPGSASNLSYVSITAAEDPANSGVYKYTSVLTSPFAAVAGTTYWLSIYKTTSSTPWWGWQRAAPPDDYIGVYGGSIQGLVGKQSNVAFELDSSTPPVPIPSAAWLLASGLIGLVVIRRRLRR